MASLSKNFGELVINEAVYVIILLIFIHIFKRIFNWLINNSTLLTELTVLYENVNKLKYKRNTNIRLPIIK